MEPNNNAESRSIYVGDAEYLLIDEVKSEPLEADQSSNVVKTDQRKRRVCDGCEKTYASYQSLWHHKKICNRNSDHIKRLDDDQPSDACSLKCNSSDSKPEKPVRKKRRTMYCVK